MKYTGTISLVISLAVVCYLAIEKVNNMQARKIGVVQMEKLVYEYKGMKEATKNYENKLVAWGSKTDTLEQRLKTLYAEIKTDSLRKDAVKLRKDQEEFMITKQSYISLVKQTEDAAVKADEQMTIGVINQINEYIKKYAQEEGYDVVLCNSPQQSIGHAKEQIDITQEVLQFANAQYSGNK